MFFENKADMITRQYSQVVEKRKQKFVYEIVFVTHVMFWPTMCFKSLTIFIFITFLSAVCDTDITEKRCFVYVAGVCQIDFPSRNHAS